MKQIKKDIKSACDTGNCREDICDFLLDEMNNDIVNKDGDYTEEEINKAIDEMIYSGLLAEGHKKSHLHTGCIVVAEWQPNTAHEMSEEYRDIEDGKPPLMDEYYKYVAKREEAKKKDPKKYLDEDGNEIKKIYYNEARVRKCISLVDWDLKEKERLELLNLDTKESLPSRMRRRERNLKEV